MAPVLSVLVLNYNYGRYLDACLAAILNQTLTDFEVIVLDDCSSDGSLNVVRPYLADPRVRLVAHTENRGYVASLIEGTEQHSTGEFLMVVSADDLVRRRNAFERQVAALRASPEVSFCFSHYDAVSGAEAMFLRRHESLDRDLVLAPGEAFSRLVGQPSMRVLHSGAMIRRSAYEAVGGYRRDLAYAVDLAMWLALSLHGSVAYVADTLYAYRWHDDQMSSSLEGYSASRQETLNMIEAACESACRMGIARREVRDRALYSYLLGWAMHEAFRGLRLEPLRRCFRAARLRPRDALRSRELWIVCLRALLGARLFSAVRSGARAVATSTRSALPSRA